MGCRDKWAALTERKMTCANNVYMKSGCTQKTMKIKFK